MSDYAGLNLPQLLELLEPIVLPDPVPLLPVTPGWWVLAGWLLTIGVGLAVRLRAQHLASRYRREALAAINALADRGLAAADTAAGIAAIVKRTALAAYPRAEVASLAGADWSEFLVRTADDDPLVRDKAGAIAAAAYRPTDPQEIVEAARRWIRTHRA